MGSQECRTGQIRYEMTTERLNLAISLRREIDNCELIAQRLDKAIVRIDTSIFYGFEEREIELFPEEQETLESIRQAYLTILHTANTRKLDELKSQFDAI